MKRCSKIRGNLRPGSWAFTRSSETPAATLGIGRELGIPICSPICKRKSPLPRRIRTSFGNRRNASRAFGWRMIDRTILLYQK